MASTVTSPRVARQRVISEMPERADQMAKVHPVKAEPDAAWRELGGCLDFARRSVGWTLDELASHLPAPRGSEKRDPRQVQRWITGEEQTQAAVVFAVPCLRAPFVIALAHLAGPAVEIQTVVTFKQQVA